MRSVACGECPGCSSPVVDASYLKVKSRVNTNIQGQSWPQTYGFCKPGDAHWCDDLFLNNQYGYRFLWRGSSPLGPGNRIFVARIVAMRAWKRVFSM